MQTAGRRILAGVVAAIVVGGTISFAQRDARGSSRKVATIEALLTYPLFFHTQQVVVRGRLLVEETGIWLVSGEQRVLVTGSATSGAETSGPIEARGTFLDVGRVEPEDARYGSYRLQELSQARLGRDRPGPGELLVLVMSSSMPSPSPPAPTVRTLALEPERYAGQTVTVGGRFRGRNLFGDLPDAPGSDRWQFVLQVADAAVWVVGRRPRGRGFDLDVNARVDTKHWVEVTGLVQESRGLVWIQARSVELTKEPSSTEAPDLAPPPPPQRIEAQVLFSAPTEEETDVPPDTRVRIQFSRDMDPASFRGQVRVSYVGDAQGLGPIEPTFSYTEGTRALELRFKAPLAPFRQVKVELLEGVQTRDKVPLKPWAVTFTTGS